MSHFVVYLTDFGTGEEARAHTVDCQPHVNSVVSMQRLSPLPSPVFHAMGCSACSPQPSPHFSGRSINIDVTHAHRPHAALCPLPRSSDHRNLEERGLGVGSLLLLPRQSENIYTPSCWHVLERPAPAVVLAEERLFFILFN